MLRCGINVPDSLTDVRQSLAAPRLVGKTDGGQMALQELLRNTHTGLVEQIKAVLANLQVRGHLQMAV